MSMEICDEATGAAANNSTSSANSECSHPVVKGKRTKRQRVHQSPAAASSTSSSGDLSGSTTEEDEVMANCLILLAQGRTQQGAVDPKSDATVIQGDDGGERLTSRRLAKVATVSGKSGFYVYECKTCNKCFPSFQALGGHRSSHKKHKMAAAAAAAAATEEKAGMEEDNPQVSVNVSNPTINLSSGNNTTTGAAATAALTRRTNTNNGASNSSNNNSGVNNLYKSRVHECSICGSEFSSGQALGGHMRRHRPAVAVETQKPNKKEKNILSLDLNLPAPTDVDDRWDYPKSPSFPFAGGQSLLFSPSAFVDCHY